MATLLTIGEFARMTHLSIKALRHYDDVGLLSPAEVDRDSGYRRYAVAQVPVAQVIRRFRDLDMPLDAIRQVLTAPDPDSRDRVLLDHLRSMEAKLQQTQDSVASLRGLLEAPAPSGEVEHRSLESVRALSISDRVRWDDSEGWLDDALGALYEALGAGRATRTGPDSALYAGDFFEAHDGLVTAFIPVAEPLVTGTAIGRAVVVDVPPAVVAVMTHRGAFASIDTTYGALGTYVTERGIGADGPLREHYLDDQHTEVCWPIRN